MNGPQHYREAERLLVSVVRGENDAPEREVIAAAQVHATLAQAAAFAHAAIGNDVSSSADIDTLCSLSLDWIKAIGGK